MDDGDEHDEKIIAVADGDPTYKGYNSIRELPAHIFDEMSHFFSVYKQLEGKETVMRNIDDETGAVSVIRASINRYNKTFSKE